MRLYLAHLFKGCIFNHTAFMTYLLWSMAVYNHYAHNLGSLRFEEFNVLLVPEMLYYSHL